jgi:hypothetical protein
MKTLKTLLVSLVCAFASLASAQTLLVNTTITSTVTQAQTNVTLGAITGLTAQNSYVIIDAELLQVTSIPSSGLTIGVQRGAEGTNARPHKSGAIAFLVPAAAAAYAVVDNDPYGACARGSATLVNGVPQSISTVYLPIFDTRDAVWSDCVGGVFQQGDSWPLQVTQFQYQNVATGGTIYTSLGASGSGTTLSASTMYCSEIDLPYNKLITGLGVLNGATVGTDNHLVALYDASGNLLANSAVAGVLAATASEYQKIAFTSPYFAVGPAQYFGCMQTNGTTANVRMLSTQVNDNYLTKGVTGQTFGTIPATITAPTTFTTAVGPYYIVY